jgi:hypothetical protein
MQDMAGKMIVTAAAAVVLSLATTAAFAQFSEPAAYAAQHPDRDVLNGGALTPAGRAALDRSNPGAWPDAHAAAPVAAERPRRARHRRH